MVSVNPELDAVTQFDPGSLTPAVRALFGPSNRAVVRAVGAWLTRPHGTFDEANLRVLAAAAPHLDDNHVVTILERMPTTGWNLPTAPISIGPLRADLAIIFKEVNKADRARVTSSLIEDSTYRKLEAATDRPESALPFVEAYITRVIRGDTRPLTVARALQGSLASVNHVSDAYRRRGRAYEVARTVASSPLAPPEALRELASRENGEFKFRVAGNPAAPADLLHALVVDTEHSRNARLPEVAANPGAAPETLRLILDLAARGSARYDEPMLLADLAGNPSAPADLLLDLSKLAVRTHEPMVGLRISRGLLANSATPTEALNVITPMFADPISASALVAHPNASIGAVSTAVVRANAYSCRHLVAREDLDDSILRELTGMNDLEVVHGVVTHPNVSKATLKNVRTTGDAFNSKCAGIALANRGLLRFLTTEPIPGLPPTVYSDEELARMQEEFSTDGCPSCAGRGKWRRGGNQGTSAVVRSPAVDA